MSDAERCVALVVEDDWLLRDELASHLREAGWTVQEASTAEGAMMLLDRERIDILITDIGLGGYMSGWDVAEAFRAARPEMPVVYTSGNTIEPRRQVPDSVFLRKPYDPNAVLEACRRLR
jgi:DNA-binding response OmpR family regulator